MAAYDPLVAHLAELDPDELAGLLRRRSEVLLGGPPRDLDETAERLWDPYALSAAISDAPLPLVQLLEAALAIGDGCRISQLTGLLDAAGADVGSWVDTLVAHALAVQDGDFLRLPPALNVLFPDPLGLGRPAVALIGETSVDTLRRVGRGLGLAMPRTRAELVVVLADFFDDPARVAGAVDSLPHELRARLADHVRDGAHARPGSSFGRAFERFDEPDLDGAGYFGDEFARAVREIEFGEGFGTNPFDVRFRVDDLLEQAAAHGLAIPARYGFGAVLPAEAVWALRGQDYHPPFDPHPPAPVYPPHQVDAVHIEQQSAAAASEISATVLALLDRIAHTPPALLKSGGLGARELTKLVKALVADEPVVRLGLELAHAAGLLDRSGPTLRTSETWSIWRAQEPARQFADLVRTWWRLGHTPTDALDRDGKATAALLGHDECALCRLARQSFVIAASAVDGSDPGDVTARTLWVAPSSHLARADLGQPFHTVRREASLLGVLVDATATELARALIADTEIEQIAVELLPRANNEAVLGSDLTAYVAGPASARVVAVLDAAADRESSGGAITWRFSTPSVRRAFDDGVTLESLICELEAIAAGGLPQPLRYLLGDVARRHGQLRLDAVTTCVTASDPALLAEVAAHRSLAKYRPRLLAPTVLAADAALPVLLDTLRKAGYFPVAEPGADGVAETVPPIRRRVFGKAVDDAPDPDAVAADLVTAGRAARTEPSTVTAKVIARLAVNLSTSEVRKLSHAVDTRGRAEIVYESSSGSRTRRVIAEPELSGDSLVAFCELRRSERYFRIDRILSVIGV